MRIEYDIKLGFKDVMFRPKRSTLQSRSQVELERSFTFRNSKKTWSGIPIIAANMDTVGTFEMAVSLAKEKIISAAEGDTKLRLKKLVPVRLLKNEFADAVAQAEAEGANSAQLSELLGRARAKLGMFEGNMDEGELEIGQVSAMLDEIKPAAQILTEIWTEFLQEKKRIEYLSFN